MSLEHLQFEPRDVRLSPKEAIFCGVSDVWTLTTLFLRCQVRLLRGPNRLWVISATRMHLESWPRARERDGLRVTMGIPDRWSRRKGRESVRTGFQGSVLLDKAEIRVDRTKKLNLAQGCRSPNVEA